MSSGFLRKYGRENEDYLSQYNQIGNSVPPLLSKAIGKMLLKVIEQAENSQTRPSLRDAPSVVEVN